MKNLSLIKERISKNQCAICGADEVKNCTNVIDANFGTIGVCGHHIVAGSKKLADVKEN